MAKTIENLPLSSRPYERLEETGEQTLSNAELLAILLKTGSCGTSALELAEEILRLQSDNVGLHFLWDLSLEELMACKGLGRVKAITIKAALEIGRRALRIDPTLRGRKISVPQDAIDLFENRMLNLTVEEIHSLLLDVRHRVIRHVVISSGGLAATGIYPRELFRVAIKANAAAMVLAHNHPSGDPTPSQEDISTTKALGKAALVLGIDLVDHIIVGKFHSVSLKEFGCF